MISTYDDNRSESAGANRKPRTAGLIITVLGIALLARGIYDYLSGSDGFQEVFMLGVSALIVFLGLYRTFSSGTLPRR